MTTPQNSRSELRLKGNFTVLIETYSAAPGDNTAPKVVICSTIDMSANGLMICMDEALTPEAIFQLYIESNDPPYRFHLVGEVRWSRPTNDGQFMTGFTLYESEGTNIAEWKTLVASLLEKNAPLA
ncbi:MAG TPA: PilZ domain-containing protein [Pseudomonadales bacterium]